MQRAKANASAASMPDEPDKPTEPEKTVDYGEKVDYEDNDAEEEPVEEEYEYEEVEEEVEVEETEEEEEEEVEEEVEEEEEVDEEEADANKTQKKLSSGEGKVIDEDEKEEHNKLLSLPPHGSEVYIGSIPHDASEDELRSFCETVGEVTEVRIMKARDSSENKGFGFVTFKTVELASKAIEELNNTEFKGRKIRCSTSQAKHRLFIGNIPRSWGEEDLKRIVTEVGPGVTAVELVKDMKNSSNNRGFAFIDYYNHACAEHSRLKMMNPKFKLGDNAPTVSWADPKNADVSSTSQVKAVYVKNLPKNVTQDQLKRLFEHHGKITKVVLPPAKSGQEKNRIGFVHFADRSCAMKALKNTEKYELDGQNLECSLAKPQADQKSVGGSSSQKSSLLPTYPSHVGYGLVGAGYGALGPTAGYGPAGFAQPMIYGRGPSPAGMAMMPMLLPDGRIGYVLQQPGPQPHAPPPHQRHNHRGGGGGSSGKSGGGSSRGRNSNDGGGRRYRPY